MKRWMSVLLCVLMLHVLPVSAAEYVVDLESEYFSSAGNWLASGLKGYNDSKTMYAREEGTSAFFASPLQKAGNVKIEFYNLSTEADPALKVRITYQTDQIAEFTFNQQTAGDGWADFGIYTFQINDIIQSLKPQFNNLFGHDVAYKKTVEFYNKFGFF